MFLVRGEVPGPPLVAALPRSFLELKTSGSTQTYEVTGVAGHSVITQPSDQL